MKVFFEIAGIVALAASLGTFVVYWISRSKEAAAVWAMLILWVAWTALATMLFVFSGVDPGALARLTWYAAVALAGYIFLHSKIVRESRQHLDTLYYLVGPGAFFGLIVIAVVTYAILPATRGVAAQDAHFMGAGIVTTGIAWLSRNRLTSLRFFQFSAVLVFFGYAVLFAADPLIYGYGEGSPYVQRLAQSLVLNAIYAIVPAIFFIYNIALRNLSTHIERKVLFNAVIACIIASLLYRNPETRAFISAIPYLGDVAPATAAAFPLFAPAVVAVSRSVTWKSSSSVGSGDLGQAANDGDAV